MALYDWGREVESSSCTFPEKGDTIWGEKSYTVRFRTVTSTCMLYKQKICKYHQLYQERIRTGD